MCRRKGIRMLQRICDRCGTMTQKKIQMDIDDGSKKIQLMDLCERCYEEFKRWMEMKKNDPFRPF